MRWIRFRCHGPLVLAAFLFCWCAMVPVRPALAHPHAFVEAGVTMLFDEHGLTGVRERWVLDAMLTATVLDHVGENMDGKLTPEEIHALETESFVHLGEYAYFTFIQVDGKYAQVGQPVDFDAELENGKLVYSFTLPCAVAAKNGPHEVKVAVYDDTFWTYVAYAGEEGSGIDPTADPLFSQTDAPADPGDFARFSESVGLGEFKGKVEIQGAPETLRAEGSVQKATDMAYFHGQIVPQAFVVRFGRS